MKRKTYLYIIGMVLLLTSCNEPYLYDRTGFTAGGHPIDPPANPEALNRIAPDYYYRQSTPYYPAAAAAPRKTVASTQQRVQPNYQGTNLRRAPQRQANQTQGVQGQNYQNNSGGFVEYNSQFIQPSNNRQASRTVPGSRFYSNPYAIPASSQYMRYDTDQYYAPPLHSQNVEKIEYGIRNVPEY